VLRFRVTIATILYILLGRLHIRLFQKNLFIFSRLLFKLFMLSDIFNRKM
ncbi:unnamed protein product, partial [Arabidopsis halleri]